MKEATKYWLRTIYRRPFLIIVLLGMAIGGYFGETWGVGYGLAIALGVYKLFRAVSENLAHDYKKPEEQRDFILAAVALLGSIGTFIGLFLSKNPWGALAGGLTGGMIVLLFFRLIHVTENPVIRNILIAISFIFTAVIIVIYNLKLF